jgi:glucosamine--fructose-6-phosphate aminotransferase (isomerizing)
MQALHAVEYRGYDSAGIATLEPERAGIVRRRAEGKLKNLESKLALAPLLGNTGIGHTRWATHGGPSEINAHPHATERVAVVHNGIIENYQDLKGKLANAGAVFKTQTDTEVVAHLIDSYLRDGDSPEAAFLKSMRRLVGAFAIVAIFKGHDDLMLGARRGSPLAIGYGEDEMAFGSDALALAPFTDRVAYLEDGDWAVLTRSSAAIYNEFDEPVTRPIMRVSADILTDKGGYKHFMGKEIHEQPEVVGHTLAQYLDFGAYATKFDGVVGLSLPGATRLDISACGTAYYAGLVARYWFERFAKLPVDIDIASEYRYREPPLADGTLSLVVSQSGETADTLEALRYSKRRGRPSGAIVNVRGSTMEREADFVLPTLAGTERGVASTKAFTSQLAVLASLAIAAGSARNALSKRDEKKLIHALGEVPRVMSQVLRREEELRSIAQRLKNYSHALYLGRGTSYPLALEGALKLKEISYIHAEGYGAGELKHGPIALVDDKMPVIVIAPYDRTYFEKTMSNMQEVAARMGGDKSMIILLTDSQGQERNTLKGEITTVVLPETHPITAPFAYAVALQLLAYHTADELGNDVDQPRNLAKSVTVE